MIRLSTISYWYIIWVMGDVIAQKPSSPDVFVFFIMLMIVGILFPEDS